MNFYVVVEGMSELRVYANWIPAVNNSLTIIDSVDQVDENNFYLFGAGGYPAIFSAIDGALADIDRYPRYTKLVIAVDSDELTREEKNKEISDYLIGKRTSADIRIIVQHFCLETWALGNKRIIRKQSVNPTLRTYRNNYDVRENDPELLPVLGKRNLTRSQFAKKYLQLVINDRRSTMSYSEGNPYPVNELTYFEQVKKRFETTGHIGSFSEFLSAFI